MIRQMDMSIYKFQCPRTTGPAPAGARTVVYLRNTSEGKRSSSLWTDDDQAKQSPDILRRNLHIRDAIREGTASGKSQSPLANRTTDATPPPFGWRFGERLGLKPARIAWLRSSARCRDPDDAATRNPDKPEVVREADTLHPKRSAIPDRTSQPRRGRGATLPIPQGLASRPAPLCADFAHSSNTHDPIHVRRRRSNSTRARCGSYLFRHCTGCCPSRSKHARIRQHAPRPVPA